MLGERSSLKEMEPQQTMFSCKSVLQRQQALIKYSPAIMANSNIAAVGADRAVLEVKPLGEQ